MPFITPGKSLTPYSVAGTESELESKNRGLLIQLLSMNLVSYFCSDLVGGWTGWTSKAVLPIC